MRYPYGSLFGVVLNAQILSGFRLYVLLKRERKDRLNLRPLLERIHFYGLIFLYFLLKRAIKRKYRALPYIPSEKEHAKQKSDWGGALRTTQQTYIRQDRASWTALTFCVITKKIVRS